MIVKYMRTSRQMEVSKQSHRSGKKIGAQGLPKRNTTGFCLGPLKVKYKTG